jgi:protein-S-isoprenylcysteine O-methyltransferase Ste14
MDPINVIVAVNLFVTMSANLSGAKKGIKSKLSNVHIRPNTYLQKVPPNIAALILILTIAAIFNLGTFGEEVKQEYFNERLIGVLLFVVFSWVQIVSFKALGKYYSQDILIFKGHILIKNGPYRMIRHPQYISHMLSDIGVGIALMGYLIIPVVILIEIPLFLLRAKAEDQLLSEYFNEDFVEFKKKSGFIIPFVG